MTKRSPAEMKIKREFRLLLHAVLPPQVNTKDNVNRDMEEDNAIFEQKIQQRGFRQEQFKLKERVDREHNAKDYSLKEGKFVRVQRAVRKSNCTQDYPSPWRW